jgi:hypothetical protein
MKLLTRETLISCEKCNHEGLPLQVFFLSSFLLSLSSAL